MTKAIGGAAIGIAALATALWCWWWFADFLLATDLSLVEWLERRRERRNAHDGNAPTAAGA